MYVESPVEEATSYWVSMAQNIIINAVKAADNDVERAFVLLNLKKGEASFDILSNKWAIVFLGSARK